jgi:hypothetical protein
MQDTKVDISQALNIHANFFFSPFQFILNSIVFSNEHLFFDFNFSSSSNKTEGYYVCHSDVMLAQWFV